MAIRSVSDWYLLAVGVVFAVLGAVSLLLLIRRVASLRRQPPSRARAFYNRVVTSINFLILMLSVGRTVEYILVVVDVADAQRISFDITLESFFPSEVILALLALLTYLWLFRIEDAREDEVGTRESFHTVDIDDLDVGSRVLHSSLLRTSVALVLGNALFFSGILIYVGVMGWTPDARARATELLGYVIGSTHIVSGGIFVLVVLKLHRVWIVDSECRDEAMVKLLTTAGGIFFSMLFGANGCLRVVAATSGGRDLSMQHHAVLLAATGTAELFITLLVIAVIVGPSVRREGQVEEPINVSGQLLRDSPWGGASVSGSERGSPTLVRGYNTSSPTSSYVSRATLPDGTRWAPFATTSESRLEERSRR